MKGELIGAGATVVASSNHTLTNASGVVVDETKHFLTLETASGRKRIPKRGNTFRFLVNGKEHTINGADIEVSPEERIKLKE